jgi:Tol biopolymer transport system component
MMVAAVLGSVSAEPGSFVTAPQRDPAIVAPSPRSTDVSADGRCVAFESYARLVPADANDRRDIYVLDLETRRVTLETSAAGAHADASHPRISGDCRLLVYEAAEAGPDQGSHGSVVVLNDRRTARSRVISTSQSGGPANGSSGDPDISDDGQVVVFSSTATNLVPEADVNGPQSDIYALAVPTGGIQRVSVDEQGGQPEAGESVAASVSGDGRRVAFASSAPLVRGPTVARGKSTQGRPPQQVYVRDLAGHTTVLVSGDAGGRPPDGGSWGPAINHDGRFVAFVSADARLADGVGTRTTGVFLRDLQTGELTLVSRGAAGEVASGKSGSPSISADGRIVAFHSDAPNLVCRRRCPPGAEDINLLLDVFLFDRARSTTRRVSEDGSGGWMEASCGPALDASGRVLAFVSRHPTGPFDRGEDFDLFVQAEAASPAPGR